MKRELYIAILSVFFLLIAYLQHPTYKPIISLGPSITARATDSCYLSQDPDKISVNDATLSLNEKIIYNNLPLAGVQLHLGKNSQQKYNILQASKTIISYPAYAPSEQTMQITPQYQQNENCQYYVLQYKRSSGRYDFKIQNPSMVGESCSFTIPSNLQNLIKYLGGIQPELINTIEPPADISFCQLSSETCIQDKDCFISIASSNEAVYGITLEKDSCGNVVIKPSNNGQPFSSDSDLNDDAYNFISACSNRQGITPPDRISPKINNRQKSMPAFSIAMTRYGTNGLFGYDSSTGEYLFCQSTIDQNCLSSPVSNYFKILDSANPYVIDTSIDGSLLSSSSTATLNIRYPCLDMGFENARPLVQIQIPPQEARYISITQYIPADYSIADGTLKAISPTAGKEILIFSYNPDTQEIVIAPKNNEQSQIEGSIVYILQKPMRDWSKASEHFEPIRASYAVAYKYIDSTLKVNYKEIPVDSRNGNCLCWKGENLGINSFKDKNGVIASLNAFVESGGKC